LLHQEARATKWKKKTPLSGSYGSLATWSTVCHGAVDDSARLVHAALKANSAAVKYSALMAEARRLQMQAIIAFACVCARCVCTCAGRLQRTYLRELTQ